MKTPQTKPPSGLPLAPCSLPSSSGISSLPPVLDACCGSRMFWFDKADHRAAFMDRRRKSKSSRN